MVKKFFYLPLYYLDLKVDFVTKLCNVSGIYFIFLKTFENIIGRIVGRVLFVIKVYVTVVLEMSNVSTRGWYLG